MKSSIIASSLLAVSLFQGIARAQVYDLPEPETGLAITQEPLIAHDEVAGSLAGSLRLGPISRKTDGSQWRVLLAEGTRLRRLDLRVSFGKSRIREATLVMESGNKIPVQRFEATGVLEPGTLANSENFSLNENVTEILISAEAFTDDAEIFLTALGDNVIPRMTVWRAPVVVPPVTAAGVDVPANRQPLVQRGANCVNEFCVGDIVIFQRQRAKITKVYADGRLGLLQRGTRKILTSITEVRRPIDFN